MNEQDNGGPAFPVADRLNFGPEVNQGMTLRDYFAAKAMVQIMDDTKQETWFTYDDTAKYAYQVADAMLKARVNTNA